MASNTGRSGQMSLSTQNLLKSYRNRLQEDIRTMSDNFVEIVKSAKVTTDEKQLIQKELQGHFDVSQMKVRAANIVRAGESLQKLISDLKTFVILNDFPSINEQLNHQTAVTRSLGDSLVLKLVEMRDQFASALVDLESEYYNSIRVPRPTEPTANEGL